MQYAVVATRVARQIEHLSEQDLAILRLCDGIRTIDEVCREVRVPRKGTISLLQRAEQAGMVVAASRLTSERRMPEALARWLSADEIVHPAVGFSEEEEAFFSRPVEIEEPWSDELAM